ncbi:MAG: hypothetical protein LBI96_03245 [Odoribacteraceae bacterium]|jgi:hypothetical protein|nr:hypothetical protein [Odoribacteraceae bacterium]
MKQAIAIFTIIAALAACSKETAPEASEHLGIIEMFSPGEDAAPAVHDIFERYGIWTRTYFSSIQEITNAILEVDALVRNFGAENLDPSRENEVFLYTSALLSNVSPEFTKKFFPLEIFYVKTYGARFWIYPLKILGRGRIIISWPQSEVPEDEPLVDPANHYYRDSTLAVGVWRLIATSITHRLEEAPAGFVAAGKAHDNGEIYERILDDYYATDDNVKYNADIAEMTANGGYITGNGSRDFRADLDDWIRLLATESYDNIKRDYLDNSKARAAKYQTVVDFAMQNGWDIQAAGNLYRQRHDALAE